MKKSVAITTGVIIVGVGAWLGGTWYTGQRIADDSQARIDKLNEQLAQALPGYGLKVEQISSERSFFSTHARYGLNIQPPEGNAAGLVPGRLEFDTTIDHGPLPAGALARGHFVPSMAFVQSKIVDNAASKPLFGAAQGQLPFSIDVVVKYGGDAAVKANTAAMTFAGAQPFALGASTFDGDVHRSFEAAKGKFELASLSAFVPHPESPMKIDATKLVVTLDGKPGKYDFQIGDSAFDVEKVVFASQLPEVPPFVMEGLSYKGKLVEEDRFVNGQIDYKLKALSVGGKNLGSQDAVFKFSRLDGNKLKTVMDTMRKISEQTAAQGQDPAELSSAQLQELGQVAKPLLADNPTLSLSPFAWRNDKGASTFDLSVTLAQPATPDASAQEMIKALDGKLVLNKPMVTALVTEFLTLQKLPPEEAAKQAARQVNNLSGMAMMLNLGKVQGDDIVGTVKFADGKLNLNGNEMPADALLGAFGH